MEAPRLAVQHHARGRGLFSAPANAANCNASDTASLVACITNAGTSSVMLTQNITLTAELPVVQTNIGGAK
jgi:hypothetical protein